MLGEQRDDAFGAGDFGEHRGIRGAQFELARLGAFDHEPPVPPHGFADVDGHRLRYRKLREALQCRQHVVGFMAGGAGIPEAEPRDPVRVNVLRGALQFGEDGEFVAGVVGVRMRHFEQHGAVALHDEGAVRHNVQVYGACRSYKRRPCPAFAAA